MNEPTTQEEKQKNFTCTPNILFASYKHLTIEEKYLWQNLKRVFWDGKPRYLSLRALSEIVDCSRSALGKMLPRLHACRLVDAVLERENGKGNEKYRITVLDISELNKQYYACPPNGRDLLDPSLKLVHENVQACPSNKPSLSTKKPQASIKQAKPVHEKRQENAVDPPVESDDDAPKDCLKDPSNISLKINGENEEGVSSVVTPLPPSEGKFITHSSSSDDSSVSPDLILMTSLNCQQVIPATHTPDLENNTNVKPEIFAQSGQVLDTSCTSLERNSNLLDKSSANAPLSGAKSSINASLIAMHTDDASHARITAAQDTLSPTTPLQSATSSAGESSVKVPGGWLQEDNQDGSMNGEIDQCEVVPVGASQGVVTNVDRATAGVDRGGSIPTGNNDQTGANHPGDAVMKYSTAELTQAELLPAVETGTKPGTVGQNLNVAVSGKEKPGRNRVPKETAKKRDLLAEATPEVRAIVQEWVSLFKKTVAVNKTLIDNAKELADYQPEPGEIKGCYTWLWTTDRDWYAKHGGIHLGTIASKFAGFRSLGDIPDDKSKKRSIDRSGFSQQSLDKEFYPTKEPTNQEKETVYAF